MAWISELDAVTLDTTPVAWAGIGVAEYAKIGSSARADLPLGQGVIGQAIRGKAPAFCNDLTAEPDVGSAIRRLAIRQGYRSLIALPLYVAGVVMGTLTLFAKERNFFTADELRLLTGLVGDISFALDNFESEARRKWAEAERARLEVQLREDAAQLRLITDNVPAMLIAYDKNLRCLFANRRFAEFFGLTTVSIVGKHLRDIIGEGSYQEVKTYFDRVLEGHPATYKRTRVLAGGALRYLEVDLVPHMGQEGQTEGLFAVTTDVTERNRAEQQLRESEARFRSLTEMSSDFYWESDVEHRVMQRTVGRNPEAPSMFWVSAQIGKRRWEVPYLSPDEAGWRAHRAVLDARRPFRNFELSRTGADGAEHFRSISGDPVFDAAGEFKGYRGVGADITERKRMEEQVRQMAFHDTLTNLPNRRLLNDRLGQVMAANKRSGCYGALMFLDLDRFKSLNDSHGHKVGDLLLIDAAERLKSCVREMDTVARFGGDEFVVMISELGVDESESTTHARIIAQKISAALAKLYVLQVRHDGAARITVEHQCTASIGVALFGRHETSQDDILKRADTAMYQAKEAGRNLVRFYESRF